MEIIIDPDDDPQALSERVVELLTSGQIEGVLSISPVDPTLASAPGAVVQVEEYDHLLRAAGAAAEDRATMAEIVSRLADLGHRELLFVGGPSDWPSAQLRLAGYRDACQRLGLHSHGEIEGAWHADTGRDALLAMPDDSPVTAVVAASDHIGVGALGAALRRGWPVPQRLSITGWDDVMLGRYAYPALSTVSVDRETAGRHAMQRLIATVEGRPAPTPPTTPLTRIVFRDTTAAPPRTTV